jgi:phosphoribosylamine--glycine ligase
LEKVGILVIAYGSREAAMIDAFSRSQTHKVQIYVADKQRNPFNVKKATRHAVIPDLNIREICKFAQANRGNIDFGIAGPEKPIVEGVRDLVEKQTKIPLICPTKAYAIEESKVKQRLLFEETVPEANPRFKVFNPKDFRSIEEVKRSVYKWLDSLGNQAVVKPDKPAAGKGVGVWGDHFKTREGLFDCFLSDYQYGPVLVEEKLDGEESSFQAFCDGNHLVPLPDTRDYKRAFDDDRGENTGGMGSYKDVGDVLPFLSEKDREKELEIAYRIFRKWKEKDGSGPRGVPLYLAFMHTREGLKILENNSRPGDPEIINILPIMKDDFVDVCLKILDGSLNSVELEKDATVVTYKVPPSYGGYAEAFPNLVNRSESGGPVDLTEAYKLNEKYANNIRIYPGSMELRNGETYALRSRAVCVVGIEDSIERARRISLEGVNAIKGGGLWHRSDIASKKHIEKSVRHLEG